jgi:hypothetical protein
LIGSAAARLDVITPTIKPTRNPDRKQNAAAEIRKITIRAPDSGELELGACARVHHTATR